MDAAVACNRATHAANGHRNFRAAQTRQPLMTRGTPTALRHFGQRMVIPEIAREMTTR
jgi:hypothetical protein